MRRPSPDQVMNWWWVVTVVVVLMNFAIALWDAYTGDWYLIAIPIAIIVGLAFQQGYYLGRRKGYERFREALTPPMAQCIGGPVDGTTIPMPGHLEGATRATVEFPTWPEGHYELDEGALHWVEDD